MSRWPSTRKWGQKYVTTNKRILRDIQRWDNETPERANLKTLERLVQQEADERLTQDILRLNKIEQITRTDDEPAAKLPCPICRSIQFLVTTDRPKILICSRPNCVYRRAIENRNRLVRAERTENVS